MENPKPCTIKFKFDGFSRCIYSFSMCYAIKMSINTIELVYGIFPAVIKETNWWIGTPYQNRKSGEGSNAGLIWDNLLQQVITECKLAQELAQPNRDIKTMNIGIDAEKKLISLIEIAEAGSERTAPLEEELYKLGQLAKQMMYISIAPLFKRLEEIKVNMADYYKQEELAKQGGHKHRE